MYTLYGKLGSGVASVHAALEIVGAPYRLIETSSWEPNAAFQDLLKVNPIGQVPTLVLEDGSALSESAAILAYLGLKYPAAKLLPESDAKRAQALRGLAYIAANCYPCITILDYPERFCADADQDDAVKERIRAGTRARLHALWDTFADTFPASPFLAGAHVGALDLLACVVSRWSGSRAHVEKSRPAFHALLQRIEADPKVAPVIAQYWPKKG